MSELKRCPFCGGEASLSNTACKKGDVWLWAVECMGCGAFMDDEYEQHVVNRWNNRKPMEEVVEKLEEAAWMTDPTYDDDGYSNDDGILVITASRALRIINETVG